MAFPMPLSPCGSKPRAQAAHAEQQLFLENLRSQMHSQGIRSPPVLEPTTVSLPAEDLGDALAEDADAQVPRPQRVTLIDPSADWETVIGASPRTRGPAGVIAEPEGLRLCDACPYCMDVCGYKNCEACATKKVRLAATAKPAKARRNSIALQGYTRCEVRRHNTRESLWIMAHGNIYDATRYVSEHPGGEAAIVRRSTAQADASEDYDFHSKGGKNVWKGLLVGELKRCPSEPESGGCVIS